jgi:hypothetical protein
MASSTTIPMANHGKQRCILMENPNICRKKKPTIATGTPMAGIKVDLKSCKNK